MDKLDKINKLFDVLKEKTVSAKELEQFIVTILKVIKETKSNFETLSKENLEVINEAVTYIQAKKDELTKELESVATTNKSRISNELTDVRSEFVDSIEQVKSLLLQIKAIKSTPGKPGKDYILTNIDKEEIASLIEVPIIEKVETIKEVPQEILGEEIVEKINELPIDEDVYKIDAKHIKNLPTATQRIGGMHYLAGTNITIEGNVISSTGGSGLINISDPDPTGQEGLITINSSTNEMKIYYQGAWIVLHTLSAVTPYYYQLEDSTDYYLTEDGLSKYLLE